MVVLAVDEQAVLDQAIDRLTELLGPDFEVAPYRINTGGEAGAGNGADAVYTVRASHTSAPYAQVVIEAKTSLTPAAAREVLSAEVRLLRQLYGQQIRPLVVAPWLSPRTREVLAARQVGYLDLTGNVDLRLPTGVLIRTEGAQQNPDPMPQRRSRGLSGAAAGIITRLLTDFSPPYRQKDLAVVGHVSPGYVSRVLQTLDDEALISRDGPYIVEVNWSALLRARAESYDVLRSNHAVAMVSRKGSDAVYRSLITQGTENVAVVTGSFAAREIAPVAVGGPLLIYVEPELQSIDDVADELSLIRAENAIGNIILLQPNNRGPLLGNEEFGAARRVALSQLVIDCLSGPGRMPAEGEAVLAHMVSTEGDWTWRRRPGELAKEVTALA